MGKCNSDKKVAVNIPIMKPHTKSEINDVIFLKKLSTLQEIIYKRAIHISKDYQDAKVEMLVELSRSALFNATQGNDIFVNQDEQLYSKRKNFISNALGDLYAMNRPIKELSFNDIFSEDELENVCNLSTECIKILKSIQETDKSLFNKQ